jgi:hypothetical protein
MTRYLDKVLRDVSLHLTDDTNADGMGHSVTSNNNNNNNNNKSPPQSVSSSLFSLDALRSISAHNVSMQRVHLACRLLTLDSPADIRRYTVLLENMALFTQRETDVRRIMGKRIEFSKEAVKNVPLMRFS